MKKILGYVFIFLSLCSISSCKKEDTKNDSRFDEIISRLDKIEKPEIASVQMQVEAIRASLPEMEDIPEAVETFSKSLDGVADILKAAADAATTETASLVDEFDKARDDAAKSETAMRSELVRQVDIIQADVLSQLEEIRTLVESNAAAIHKVVSISDALALQIRSDFANTKSYAYSTPSDSWEEATISTLSYAKSLSVDFAAVSALGEGLDNMLADTYSVLCSEASANLNSALLPISYRITSETTEKIAENYATAISDALETLRKIWSEKIPNKIPVVQNMIANWINPSLGAFEQIAKADSLLSYSALSLTSTLNSQKTYLESLKAVPDTLIDTPTKALSHNEEGLKTLKSEANDLHGDMADALSDLYSAYSQALSGAITDNNGKIEGDFALNILKANTAALQAKDAVSKALSKLDTQVEGLKSEVGQVKKSISRNDINVLDKKIEAIASKLKSITFVPYYSDGSSPIYYTEYRDGYTPLEAEISYDIQPASVAEELADIWDKALTLKGVYTNLTKVSAGDGISFKIKDFSQENGRITISFLPEGLNNDFFEENLGASVCLFISSGGVSKGSTYSSLTPHSIDWVQFSDENFSRYLIINCDSNSDGHISIEEALEVKEIDLSQFTTYFPIRSLDGIEHFSNLEKLRCNSHLTGELNLSSNLALVEVDCSNNNLEGIDLTGCSDIETLNISNNPLRTLDISDLTSLKELTADNCKYLTALDLSNNTALTNLSMRYNGLSDIDLRNNTSLSHFDLFDASSHGINVQVQSLDWLVDTYSTVGGGVNFYDKDGNFFYGGSVEVDGLLWMRYDSCGEDGEYFDLQGDTYEWEGSTRYCPDGWRLPTASEFTNVIKNHSSETQRLGISTHGFWFSGSQPYSDSVPSVFLNKQKGYAQGYYWSGDNDGSAYAPCLFFNSYDTYEVRNCQRTERHSNRCVKDKE